MERVARGPVRWVASFPKSGNTWLRRYLMMYFCPADRSVDLNQRPIGFFQDSELEHWVDLLPKDCAAVGDLPFHEVYMMRPAAMVHMMHRMGGRSTPMVVKSHAANVPDTGLGECSFPPAFAGPSVYLVRDPRAVLPSFADHMGMTLDRALELMLDEGYALVSDDKVATAPVLVSSWGQHVASWTRPTVPFPVRVIRYEDMRLDPDAVFRSLVPYLFPQFCPGGAVDEVRHARAMAETSLDALRAQEDTLDAAGTPFRSRSCKQARFFRTGKVGRAAWAGVLSRDHVRRLEEAFGPTMTAHGYELTEVPADG